VYRSVALRSVYQRKAMALRHAKRFVPLTEQ
jgi:hypothetical protein